MARTERSKQKAREKAKKKSNNRKQARRRQHDSALAAVNAPLSEVAAHWDWSECFASEDWHDRGARVRAFAIRSHETGARTAAIFDIDLDRGGVVGVELMQGAHPGEVQNEVISISGDKPLMVVDPGVVLALLQAGQRRALDTGASDHKDLEKALEIFGDTGPDKVTILTGSESDPGDDPAPEKEGLWGRLKRSFGS
ncbi:MAG: hypothetical protein ACI9VR_000879 [Cognaticolwellia sp.]|jgi:hypothetical protein